MQLGKVTILFLAMSHPLPSSLVAQVSVNPKGETVISSGFKTGTVQVKIRTHELPNGTGDKPVKPSGSSCTMSRIPCSAVDEVGITVAGEPLFVPRSAFADLADINNAKLATEHEKYLLILVGGDASESYVVKIEFDRKHITYRSLTSGEFPERLLQETYYHLD